MIRDIVRSGASGRKIGLDLPDEIIIGLPEATVVTILDSYFYFKINQPSLRDGYIFSRIALSRFIAPEEAVLLSGASSIERFIEKVLAHENQDNFLSTETINQMISEYKRFRGVQWSI